MNLRESWAREKHVAVHGQTWQFRVVKYSVLIPLFFGVYYFFGLWVMGILLAGLSVLAISLHALLSWKTERWTKSWWLYKKIPLENEI